MKKIMKPEFELIEFDANDVIATSVGSKLTFPYTGQTPTKVDTPSESQDYDKVIWNINS